PCLASRVTIVLPRGRSRGAAADDCNIKPTVSCGRSHCTAARVTLPSLDRLRRFSNLAVVFVCHLGNSCSADTPAHSTSANQPFCSGPDLVDAYRRILLDRPSSPLLALTRPRFRIGRERAAPASPVAKARGGSAASAHPPPSAPLSVSMD